MDFFERARITIPPKHISELRYREKKMTESSVALETVCTNIVFVKDLTVRVSEEDALNKLSKALNDSEEDELQLPKALKDFKEDELNNLPKALKPKVFRLRSFR